MKLNYKYSSVLKSYVIGWFVASIIWLLVSNTNKGKITFIETSYANELIIFLVTWLLQAFVYGFLQIIINKFVKNRVPFFKLQIYSLLLQLITAIFIVISVFVIFKSANILEEGTDILTFLNDLDGLWVVFVFALIVNFTINTVDYIDLVLGKGNLLKMIKGTFYAPREDEKIFMFLDLRSSTTYAEKLGHVLYSKLIQDCFDDLAVVNAYEAEIYQYVGDESVLTWSPKDGLKNNNCIRAFFAFKDAIHKRASYYMDTYGVLPEFKAGLNTGVVMVAEVGKLKREIAYHGDTINTAARLEGECNRLKAEMVISEHLKNALKLDSDFSAQFEDEIILKGKNVALKVYSVERIS
ncbi:adenylate/guanylate cyclase domain-containing protein [uncultured Kordia sp.]|uniref:adenylate/guanylate cyclase domain-containing protein n=1 Tax=uncultured Kordia sp. TaxID=507699 RepID=UPI00261D9CEF|nr:adenylate/guanylate cyclase domain-containing protein [uncultured Kordia sp.]